MSSTVNILIADDHPVFRSGLRMVIAADPGFTVVGEAGDGMVALDAIRTLRPDIAILDINMPHMNGLDVARHVSEEKLPVDVVILTMHNAEDIFTRALDLGVKGYVLKESAVSDIMTGVRAVAEGKYFVSPQLTDFLLSRNERARALFKRLPSLDDLTPSERRILRLISEDKTSREIAGELHISPKTVENHRANISAKLNLRGNYSLWKFALQNRELL